MASIAGKLRRRTDLKVGRRVLRGLLLCISFLLLFGFVGRGTAEAADLHGVRVAPGGPGPQFAIADFDGDLRPDLASIQAGQNSYGNASYRIQLQLSATGRQSFQLVAPAGGLFIEARDVNGDHAVDLVLATAWSGQPVAIFLNDGHGSFSRVEPTAFPEAFSEATTNLAPGSNTARDAVGFPAQSRPGIYSEAKALGHLRPRASSIPLLSTCFLASPFLISHAGRAPPAEVSYL